MCFTVATLPLPHQSNGGIWDIQGENLESVLQLSERRSTTAEATAKACGFQEFLSLGPKNGAN